MFGSVTNINNEHVAAGIISNVSIGAPEVAKNKGEEKKRGKMSETT